MIVWAREVKAPKRQDWEASQDCTKETMGKARGGGHRMLDCLILGHH